MEPDPRKEGSKTRRLRAPLPGQWCYQEAGKWFEFDLKSADTLEAASKANASPSKGLEAPAIPDSQVKRMLVQWYWEGPNRRWKMYDPELNGLIEAAARTGASSVRVKASRNRQSYIVYIEKKLQVNVSTKRERHVLRTLMDPESKAAIRARSSQSPGIRPPKRSLSPSMQGSQYAKLFKAAAEAGLENYPVIATRLAAILKHQIHDSSQALTRGCCRMCPRRRVGERDKRRHPQTEGHPPLTQRHYLLHTQQEIQELSDAASLSRFIPRGSHSWGGDKVRFVVFSDTHGRHRRVDLPPGDVLIHCGDITGNYGRRSLPKLEGEFQDFVHYLQDLKQYKLKIFIAGNHDILLDTKRYKKQYPNTSKIIRRLPKDIVYLQNGLIEYEGLKIWGSPTCASRLEMSGSKFYSDAFERTESERTALWGKVPEGIDVLVTHTPPAGVLDETDFFRPKKSLLGDSILARRLEAMKSPPKVHVFGHCHRDTGVRASRDGRLSINASMGAGIKSSPNGQGCAYVFDVPIKGSKDTKEMEVEDNKI
mmetsp:Transcript_18370/g.32901  ORF Transcript_18370/g.32901 Transcript_18370/m.32901 type:complete len:537 (+) Transcript_18370:1-1611(+)